jgi:SAM-dependent methyltransferase
MPIGLSTTSASAAMTLLAHEAAQVRRALESVFGDEFLQLGLWGPADVFRSHARTRRKAVLDRRYLPGVDLVSAADDLAIATDSVDAVLLPHSMETARDPYVLLRETDRILRPDGHLLVLGFNPWGPWGVRHAMSRHGFPTGIQRMLSVTRLRDWMRLLGFMVVESTYFHHVLPHGADLSSLVVASACGGRDHPTEARGPENQAWFQWRILAGCYLLVARKQVFGVTRVRPIPLRRRRGLVGGLVHPTTRNAA